MKKIFLIILVLVFLVLSGGYWMLKRTEPVYSGKLRLSGLNDRITVKFDAYGIPHIYAKSESDAFFALGYLQAQERLFQMEMIRRVSTGTLSEILGKDFLAVDKLFRTLGINEKAKDFTAKFNAHDQAYKNAVYAYFNGINAFVNTGPTPIEFTLIGIPKKEFSVTDAYNAAGYMSFGFADGFRVDPLTSKIAVTLGSEYLQELGLHSVYDSTYLKSYIKPEALILSQLSDILDKLPTPLIDGSNSWIIGSAKSASGMPIFENDTHIGFSQPSVWYEAHLEYPGKSLYGHFLAGFPFAILGHNKFATWGMTMFENDDVDLFQEKANPENDNQIWRVNEWQNLSNRKEVINIKDEDPVTLNIRTSDHGPVINEVLLDKETRSQPVSVWWAYLHAEKDIFESIYLLNNSSNIDDARTASSLIEAPGLNVMYADIEGNIAWWAAAKLPIRPVNANSKLLLDGSSGKDDYLGFYDFESNPQAENPPWGYVYSANNQPDSINGVLYPGYYRPIDRAGQIVQLIESKKNWTVTDVQKMTSNVESPIASLVAHQLAKVLSNENELEEITGLLKNWNGDHLDSAIEPTIYYNLLSWVLYYAMADELGYSDYVKFVNTEVMKRSYLMFINNENSLWWDDINTESHETRDIIIAKAARKTLEKIIATTGSTYSRGWTWGKVHTLTHGHPLGKVDLLKPYFDVGPLVTPGGNEVINNMMFKLDTTGYFPVYAGPAVRTVIDLANIDAAMSINPTGQSGNILSKHYKDQAQMFIDVKFRPQLMNETTIEKTKRNVLILDPVKAQ